MKDDLRYYARYAWTGLKSSLRISLNNDKRHFGERIARGIKAGAISRKSIFTASIRRDGVGSQALSRLSVEAAARDLGIEYAHTPFESIAHAEGDPAAWRDRCEEAFALGDGKRLARDIDLPRVGLIEFANTRSLWGTPHMIAIPHLYVYCDRAPDIYRRVVPRRPAPDTGRNPLRVAAHVRRGDVSASAVSHRYTSSGAVLTSLQALARLLAEAGRAVEATVYSNGKPEEFAKFTDMGYRVVLDLGALETFERLCDADILLTAKSTFSYVAGLYTNGIVLYETFDRAPMSSWIPRDRNGMFSEGRFAALLKARP